MLNTTTDLSVTKRAYSPVEAAKATSICRTRIFAALRKGELQGRKLGRRTIILAEDLERYLASLPAAR